MRKILFAIMLMLVGANLVSCLNNSVEDQYKTWHDANKKWFNEQSVLLDEKGHLFYNSVAAPWDPNAHVLIHWFNDRELTKDNLKPLYTSTVDVKYKGCLYNGTPFDSSFQKVDSLSRFAINNTIEGWGIALPQMHVGDSCRVVIDYPQGYGTYSVNDLIKPYSVLQFDIKLVDIYKYESKP